MFDSLRRALTRKRAASVGPDRRVRYKEEPPSEGFVLIVALMIIFFAGLIALELVNMLVFASWNDVVFNGIMLIVGTIVGAVWGRMEGR